MKRKGISFTLTLVVLGVVLLMTAFSLILMGQGSIGKVSDKLTEETDAASVKNACNNLANRIDNAYCDWYANVDETADPGQRNGCNNVKRSRDPQHTQTASQQNCNWYNTAQSGATYDPPENDGNGQTRLQEELTQKGQYEPIVVVDGKEYNCLNKGYFNKVCSAG